MKIARKVARKSTAKIWTVILFLLATVYLSANVLSADDPLIVGCNIDVHNNTGKDVNDFHIRGRIDSTKCKPVLQKQFGWITVPANTFPNFTLISLVNIGGDSWEFDAEWSGRNVNPSQVGHFGIFFEVCGKNVYLNLDGWWTQDGKKVPSPNGNGWPIPGFEVPEGDQVFRLQGDAGEEQIPLQVLDMDLALMRGSEDNEETQKLLSQLNAQEMDKFGATWIPITEMAKSVKLPFDLPEGASSFFEVPLDAIRNSMIEHDLLIARIKISWPDEPDGRWVFEVHQVPRVITALGSRGALTTTWGNIRSSD